VDVGESVEGRRLWAVVLTDRPGEREPDESSMRVLGAHHGDEWISYELALSLAWHLAGEYEQDDEVTGLLNQHEVWIWPVVNPDGVVIGSRYNARGVDLNRNYDFAWLDLDRSGMYGFSEPETRAVRTLAMARSFHQSVSIHSGATNLGWVWNHTSERSSDEAYLRTVAERYLEATTQRGFWITNGADWYIISGDTNDWSYGKRGGHDYTLEIANQLTPAADRIETIVDDHLQALTAFLARDGRHGVHGRVVDVEGRPIDAWVRLGDSGWPLSVEPDSGSFTKVGPAGQTTLRVEAVGMRPQSIPVTVPDADLLQVQLEPIENVVLSDSWGREIGTSGGRVCFRSEGLSDWVGQGGTLGLYRSLVGEVEPLQVTQGPDDEISVRVSASMAASVQLRSGAWSLVGINDAGEPVFQWPWAVFIGEDTLMLSPGSTEEQSGVRVERGTWPEGSEVELVGPTLQRMNWVVSPSWVDQGVLTLPLESDALETGRWSLRARVAGVWEYADQVIEVGDGTVTVVERKPCGSDAIPTQPESTDTDPLGSGSLEVRGESCACDDTQPQALGWLCLLALGRFLTVHKRRQELGS
ncbi:MAG: M14 family zinc carboxypeptidase, partial [Myxococcota bacterium]|nr:M14 family zinc carboxypeptidase [Myxococcota bacterium]